MTFEELLRSLLVERYDHRWWDSAAWRQTAPEYKDDDVSCARRRRELADSWPTADDEATG